MLEMNYNLFIKVNKYYTLIYQKKSTITFNKDSGFYML